ncbi:hypothetical protein PG984_008230 [Apiospora sp. TS-2023a]
MTAGLPFPPGFVSTATITTTTAATAAAAAAATSDKDVSGSSKNSGGDQGLSPAAVVGISIAIHIVVTIILVLFVRAYRKQVQEAQEGPAAAATGRRRGAWARTWRMTQDTTWIKLQDNVAATSSDAWSSPRDARHSASDRTPSLPPPAVLPHPSTPTTTTATTTQNRNVHNNIATVPNGGGIPAPGGLNISNPTAGAGLQLPSYRTSRSSDTYNFFGRAARVNAADASEEPAAHSTVWNDARWNEVLYRTLQEPPRSQTASLCQASVRSLGGRGGAALLLLRRRRGRQQQQYSPTAFYGRGLDCAVAAADALATAIGHRPEDLSSNQTMVVREAVPPPLRPSTRPRPPPPPEAFQSRWSLSS